MPLPTSHLFIVPSSPTPGHRTLKLDGLIHGEHANPIGDARNNVLGTINLLEACRRARVERIVYAASGGSRYGTPMSLPATEDTPVEPLSPNAAAKLAAELYLCAYSEMCGMSPISLALGSVYGPRQNPHGDSGVVAVFGSAMITGSPSVVYRDRAAPMITSTSTMSSTRLCGLARPQLTPLGRSTSARDSRPLSLRYTAPSQRCSTDHRRSSPRTTPTCRRWR